MGAEQLCCKKILPNNCEHCCTQVMGLNVTLNGCNILRDVNLHINCNQLIAIVGPNGAGKSTLLKAMLGEIPYRGKIIWKIKGQPVKNVTVGYVPQVLDFPADTPVTVSDLFYSCLQKKPVWLKKKSCHYSQSGKFLEQTNAVALAEKKLGELSGGELQRVLLALALAGNPNILLLDEPISGVDSQGMHLFYKLVLQICQEKDLAVLMVTHDILSVAQYAHRVLLLNKSVLADGTPAQVFESAAFTQIFSSHFSISHKQNIEGKND